MSYGGGYGRYVSNRGSGTSEWDRRGFLTPVVLCSDSYGGGGGAPGGGYYGGGGGGGGGGYDNYGRGSDLGQGLSNIDFAKVELVYVVVFGVRGSRDFGGDSHSIFRLQCL